MQSVSIIGVGRVGGALALALSKAGFRIENLIHRDPSVATTLLSHISGKVQLASIDSLPRITSDVILITTADPDIQAAAEKLAPNLDGLPVVLHTSGSLSSNILANLAATGCATGSMHPLVSISDAAGGSENFENAFFCIEGDATALATAEVLVKALGGKTFSIPSESKPLYHAAAVTACGHLVALIDVAIEMLSKCGLERDTAQAVLIPLIESTIANLTSAAPAQALTGTFARMDVAAMERHLGAIDSTMPSAVREIYLLLGERSLELAAANGAKASDVEELRERILIAKRKPE